MSAPLRYRGREISADDVAFIRQLIAAHPGDSRRALSAKLCDTGQWQQARSNPLAEHVALKLGKHGQQTRAQSGSNIVLESARRRSAAACRSAAPSVRRILA